LSYSPRRRYFPPGGVFSPRGITPLGITGPHQGGGPPPGFSPPPPCGPPVVARGFSTAGTPFLVVRTPADAPLLGDAPLSPRRVIVGNPGYIKKAPAPRRNFFSKKSVAAANAGIGDRVFEKSSRSTARDHPKCALGGPPEWFGPPFFLFGCLGEILLEELCPRLSPPPVLNTGRL